MRLVSLSITVQCNSHCGVRNDVYKHTCCVLLATSALLIRGFSCQTRDTTIVCSTTSLCKTLGEIIVFRNESLASTLGAFFRVQCTSLCVFFLLFSLCVLKNDVFTLVMCLLCAVHFPFVWYDALAPLPEVLLPWYLFCACAVFLETKFLSYMRKKYLHRVN